MQGLLVFLEGPVRLVLLARDLDVLDAERDHERDRSPRGRRATIAAAEFRRLAHLTSRSTAVLRRAGSARRQASARGRRQAPRPSHNAGLGLLGQALEADRLQVAIDPRVDARSGRSGSFCTTWSSVSNGVSARNGDRPVSSS